MFCRRSRAVARSRLQPLSWRWRLRGPWSVFGSFVPFFVEIILRSFRIFLLRVRLYATSLFHNTRDIIFSRVSYGSPVPAAGPQRILARAGRSPRCPARTSGRAGKNRRTPRNPALDKFRNTAYYCPVPLPTPIFAISYGFSNGRCLHGFKLTVPAREHTLRPPRVQGCICAPVPVCRRGFPHSSRIFVPWLFDQCTPAFAG